MWRGSRYYLLRLRICVLGRNETVVNQHEEGSTRSWTSSVRWFRHRQRRRCKHWYWDVSRRDVSTAWKAISILGNILPFLLGSNYIISRQVSFGTLNWPSVSEFVDELIDALIEKKAPFVRWQLLSVSNNLWFKPATFLICRYLLMHPHELQYRSNWQKESNYQVWEC